MPTPGLHFYRTSLTQTLSCVGSWSADGNLYMIVSGKIWAIFLSRSVFKSQLSRINISFHLGEVWEYWQPGEYKNSDKAFSCMSLTTDGMKIFLSQVNIYCWDFSVKSQKPPKLMVTELIKDKTILTEFWIKLWWTWNASDSIQWIEEYGTYEKNEAWTKLWISLVVEKQKLANYYSGIF